MRDSFRYQLVDEPRYGLLSRFALPPFLVFIVATVFQPWGYVLVGINAITINGPSRNSEIGLSLGALLVYFASLLTLNEAARRNLMSDGVANYLFVAAVGLAMVLLAFAYVSQARAFELRRYLKTLGTE